MSSSDYYTPTSEESYETEDDKSVSVETEESIFEIKKPNKKKVKEQLKDLIVEDEEEEEEEEFWCLEVELEKLQKEKPLLYSELTAVRAYLMDELPTIETLLEAKISLKNKAHLVEMYEMFIGCEPLTFEWLELKKRLNTSFQKALSDFKIQDSLSEEDRIKLEDELTKLKSQNGQVSMEIQVALLNLPIKYKAKLYERYQLLENTDDTSSDEYSKNLEWMHTVLRFPWGIYKPQPSLDVIKNIKEELDREFYGMNTIKEQVLLFINNRLNNPTRNDYCLGLIGEAGVGKTSIAMSISRILNFPFQQLSGGSLVHTDDIHGHSFAYIGSGPGDIVSSILRMECLNGILFIDEFDKIPMEKSLNSLLQLLDPVQNHNFKDKYIGDIPIDLSRMWFICSMNELPTNQALRDRIFTIDVPGYTLQQKLSILQKHTLPKLLTDFTIDVQMNEDVLRGILQKTSGNPGMRQAIHLLKDILGKIQFLKQHSSISTSFSCDLDTTTNPIVVEPRHLSKLLISKTSPMNSMYV